MTSERIVSIGFLTQANLDRLGETFTLHFEVPDDDMFEGLLAELDKVEAIPLGKGVTLMPNKQR